MHYAAFSNNCCISGQLCVLGRKRIHVHGSRRLYAGVEHARLRATAIFSNSSIVSEDAVTHRSPLFRRVNAHTKRRQTHVPATWNIGTPGRPVVSFRGGPSHGHTLSYKCILVKRSNSFYAHGHTNRQTNMFSVTDSLCHVVGWWPVAVPEPHSLVPLRQ